MNCSRGSRNSQVARTNGAVRVGSPNGVSAMFMAPCTRTVNAVPTSAYDDDPRPRLVEHGAERNRRQHRAEAQQPAGDQLALGAEQVRGHDRDGRAKHRDIPAATEFTARPEDQQDRRKAVPLQEDLRNALQHGLEEITELQRVRGRRIDGRDQAADRQRADPEADEGLAASSISRAISTNGAVSAARPRS